jgi:hypothetical protein
MQGSQFRNKDGWLNDPLSGIIGPFMNPTISPVFGPQNVPYLSAVTALTGTGNNALAAVPTAALPVPYMVKIAITGDSDYQLQQGVIVGAGTVAPNDQASSNKTWVQVS